MRIPRSKTSSANPVESFRRFVTLTPGSADDPMCNTSTCPHVRLIIERMAEQLVEHFYGDWTDRIYDNEVADCLRDLAHRECSRARIPPAFCRVARCLQGTTSSPVRWRQACRAPARSPPLATSENMRRLFLGGFLCANLLPGYYQFRNLAARFIVEEHMALQPDPIQLLRHAANTRVNLLLQDAKVSLRGILKTVFRQMPPDQGKEAPQEHQDQAAAHR